MFFTHLLQKQCQSWLDGYLIKLSKLLDSSMLFKPCPHVCMWESVTKETHFTANTATCFGLPSAKHNCSLPQSVSGSNICTEITIMESILENETVRSWISTLQVKLQEAWHVPCKELLKIWLWASQYNLQGPGQNGMLVLVQMFEQQFHS